MKKKKITALRNARAAMSANAKEKMIAGASALMLTFSGVAAGPVASYAMDKTQSTDVVVAEAAPEQEMHALETEEAKSPAPAVDGAGQQQVSNNKGATAKAVVDKANLEAKLSEAGVVDKTLYTDETVTALEAAIAEADKVVKDTAATQEAVNAQVEALDTAIKALVTKAEPLDYKNLKNGEYTVTGDMVKIDKKTASMANNAVDHAIKLTVKDGVYTLTMDFDGMTIGTQLGYLGTLKYFSDDYTVDQFGRPKGTLSDATIDSYQLDDKGNRLKDNFGTDYPDLVSFPMIPRALEDGYVPLQVFVPIMESISEGNGTQEVFLHLDWNTIKVREATDTDKSEPSETPNDKKPDNSGTTGSLSGGNTLGGGGGSLGGGKPGGSLGSGNNLQSAAGVQTGDEAQNNILWAAVLLLGGVSLMAGVMEYKKKKEAKQE